jgi:hypothetical protein
MNSKQYPEEHHYLAETVTFLDSEIAKRKARSPARGPYKEDARSLQEMGDKCIADYERIRLRPYFARVDFSELDDGGVIRGYIGTDHIPRNRVYSWASPFAGQIFYADPDAVSGWDAPEGRIEGEIVLKRQGARPRCRGRLARRLRRRILFREGPAVGGVALLVRPGRYSASGTPEVTAAA